MYSYLARLRQSTARLTELLWALQHLLTRHLSLQQGTSSEQLISLREERWQLSTSAGKGSITLDGVKYDFDYKDGIYIAWALRRLYLRALTLQILLSSILTVHRQHKTYPTKFINPERDILSENKKELGCLENANHRTIRKYILPGQVESCQLEMGMTALEPGSVWNTMPCHTHDRRMEVYLYFEVPENDVVFHYMGEPTQTRHIVREMRRQLSPQAGQYIQLQLHMLITFIWGMGR